MSDLLRLSVSDLRDPAVREAFGALTRRAAAVDGQPPFNDQAVVDATAGARTLVAAIRVGEGSHADTVVGYGIVGRGELEMVVDPEWRGAGWGRAVLEGLLANTPDGLLAWSHGDHPAARALAASHDFVPVRRLLRLAADVPATAPRKTPDGLTVRPFAESDADAWVELNALVFAHHPEQGSLRRPDLDSRRAEDWFDADDFLVLEDAEGRLVGYDWLKLEPGAAEGEVYALGVHPSVAGRGLGRVLLDHGLARMSRRGRSRAVLYVEGDNEPALRLYRGAGFHDDTVDVQYRHTAAG